MQPNPELLDELYHKKRKEFPEELIFPERFNLNLNEESFQKGIRRESKSTVQKYVDFQGNPLRNETVTTLKYEPGSRVDKAFEDSLPKSFSPISHIYSQLYDNIQIGTYNEALDLEYNFSFHTTSARVLAILVSYDSIKTYNMRPPDYRNETLRVRIQYAERIVNSVGARWDCHGYIYIPKRRNK